MDRAKRQRPRHTRPFTAGDADVAVVLRTVCRSFAHSVGLGVLRRTRAEHSNGGTDGTSRRRVVVRMEWI
ncbi:hypothetical protein [Saccharopolyspora hattusasensis]|uniref:hypothetical protein n=1 Tax=Saccharopolyspora hattusasensis TaxID=1128679 RepID=UPI003D98AEE2